MGSLRRTRSRIRLVHWNAAEADECAERLRAAGYQVTAEPYGPGFLRELRHRPPAAVVIDLSRLPSAGRDVAMAIRHSRSTRRLPVVFVAGVPPKVDRIRTQLPDAVYATWGRIRSALRHAIAHPPMDPTVPVSGLAGYSGTPLVQKLGIKPNAVVALVNAPDGFEGTLGTLPTGVTLRRRSTRPADLTIWFLTAARDLRRGIQPMATCVGRDGLWIAWPKHASGLKSDVTQADVRRVGLAAGLVDYKVCAIDATWSGLKFATRKAS